MGLYKDSWPSSKTAIERISINCEAELYDIAFFRCFTDAQETGSKSQYFPRVQDNKLQFQLGTFRFHQQDTNSVSKMWLIKWWTIGQTLLANTVGNRKCLQA